MRHESWRVSPCSRIGGLLADLPQRCRTKKPEGRPGIPAEARSRKSMLRRNMHNCDRDWNPPAKAFEGSSSPTRRPRPHQSAGGKIGFNASRCLQKVLLYINDVLYTNGAEDQYTCCCARLRTAGGYLPSSDPARGRTKSLLVDRVRIPKLSIMR